jgi:hypothetical protein
VFGRGTYKGDEGERVDVSDERARRVRHERLLRVLIVLVHDIFQEKGMYSEIHWRRAGRVDAASARSKGTRSSSRGVCCGSFLSSPFLATMRPSALCPTAVRLHEARLVVDTPRISQHRRPFAWLRAAACPRGHARASCTRRRARCCSQRRPTSRPTSRFSPLRTSPPYASKCCTCPGNDCCAHTRGS